MTGRTTGRVRAVLPALALAAGLLWPSAADAQTVAARYTALKARDDAARQQILDTPATAPAAERTKVITDAREIIADYEAMARRYRASGYADNALFNGASLAEALHLQYALTTDLDTALRLYRRLRSEYPTASLVKNARAALTRLEALAEAAAPIPPAELVAADAAARRDSNERPTLTAIDRTVTGDMVRITLELDGAAAFKEETLTGPARLFFDFKGIDAAPSLVPSVLRYPGGDLVRQIRVGRHPNAIRVVLDMEGVAEHRVYTLEDPFRVVVEAQAPAPPSARSAAKPPDAPSAPSPAAEAPAAPATDGPSAATKAPAQDAAPASRAAAPPTAPVPAAPVPAAPVAKTPVAAAAPAAPAEERPSPPTPAKGNAAGGFSIARQLGLGVSRVVIDPGHGGHDPGAQARGIKEADVTLDIALRLEKLLAEESGMEVVLTRRTDVYVPLEERTAIANREGADLFLSIHANTSRNTNARGVETFFLSFAGTPDAEAVAARENSAHAGEMRALPDIVKAITLNSKLDESRDLAAMVQDALVSRLRRSNKSVVNRGVKKAPFVVLIGAEMPSVLAEVAFMTNRQELQLLKTNAYKQRIAEALHAAVLRYRRSLKGAAAIAAQGQAP